MRYNDLYKDPVMDDREFLPDITPVSIDSDGNIMYGVLYTASGEGPHPTMLLLHGFPGNERNFDLAHAFRRAGWNTLVFHYRGSWGSDGCFSFQNVLDDVKAALKFVKSDEVSKNCRIDKNNIVLFGHSMGGFAALLSTIDDSDISACIAVAPFDFGVLGEKAKEDNEVKMNLKDMLKEGSTPLKGTTAESLLKELICNGEKWSFVNNAKKLSKCKLLLFSGERDDIAAPEAHYYPLLNALIPYNPEHFEYHLLDSDHSFQDKRIVLSEIIERWLEK